MKKILIFILGAAGLLLTTVLAVRTWEKSAQRSCANQTASEEVCAIVVEKCRLKGCYGNPPTEGFWAWYFNFIYGIGRGG